MQAVGFHGFQATIDAITEALGEPTLQPAIAHHAIACLEVEVRQIRKLSSWGSLSWGTWWTTCSTEEFDAGARRLEATLALGSSRLARPPVAEAAWRGTMLRLRSGTLQAEGRGYHIIAGRYFEGSPQYDRRLQKSVSQWQVSMDKQFLDCAGKYLCSGQPQTSHAKSEEGAAKALRRMAKDFFGVELRDL